MALAKAKTTLEGVGSTDRMMGRMFLLFYMEWVLTREECVPNEHIVDHANVGGAWISTFELDETGATLSMAFGWSSKVPLVGEIADRVGRNGDKDLDLMLVNLKKAIES